MREIKDYFYFDNQHLKIYLSVKELANVVFHLLRDNQLIRKKNTQNWELCDLEIVKVDFDIHFNFNFSIDNKELLKDNFKWEFHPRLESIKKEIYNWLQLEIELKLVSNGFRDFYNKWEFKLI